MHWLGRKLCRLGYVRRAIAARADLSRFRQRPRRRLLVGLLLLAVSMVLGWPAVSFFVALAVWLGEPFFAVFAAPGVYVFSWVLYVAGFWVGGPEALRYVRDFNRWLTRVVVSRMLGKAGVAELTRAAEGPPGPTGPPAVGG